jgi:3-oxoacyl-[acyl-carrier-protein] synthase II
VVVTGLGSVNPLGLTAKDSFAAAVEGRSGIAPIAAFDPGQLAVTIAGEVRGFSVDAYVPKKEQKKMDRFIHFAMACAQMAMQDSGVQITPALSERAGALIGVGMGGLPEIEDQHKILVERGPSRISPFFIPAVITNLASGQVSIQYGLKGPNFAVTSACASANHSIGEAYRYIRDGYCDVMIAGGSESTVCPLAVGGFAAMRALSTRNDTPTTASRPWDRDRDGFVLGEGCGILVLEDYESAAKRGARIYCELAGYGVSSDAHHITNPSPGGAGAAHAMRLSLNDAGLSPESVDYINAHGTSTPVGDLIETQAIKSVFGDHARRLWVSSTKSMTGHLLGAAGAVESVFCVLALATGAVPPTINLENPSDDCDLDYVPVSAREKKLTAVLNNSFGFGGTNACLIFSRV